MKSFGLIQVARHLENTLGHEKNKDRQTLNQIFPFDLHGAPHFYSPDVSESDVSFARFQYLVLLLSTCPCNYMDKLVGFQNTIFTFIALSWILEQDSLKLNLRCFVRVGNVILLLTSLLAIMNLIFACASSKRRV